MMDIDRKILSRVYQLGCAMAQQLERQYLARESCTVACHYNTTIKPLKKAENDKLLEQWVSLADKLEELLTD